MPRDRRELRGYGRTRVPVPWPDGHRMALSVVVNIEEGSQRSALHGDSTGERSGEGFFALSDRGDARIDSWHDYGIDVGLPRLDAIFQQYQVPVTAFAAAVSLERSPEAARRVRDGAYEVCSHGHRWVPTNELTPDVLRDHVDAAVRSLQRSTGRRPVGWFSRGPNLHLRDVLRDEGGFLYDSDAFDDDLPSFVEVGGEPWLVIPYSFTYNDMKYWRSPGVAGPSRFARLLRDGFDRLYAEAAERPTMMSVGLHLRCSGLPSRAGVIRDFLAHVRRHPDVWVTTRSDIARWWWEHVDLVPMMRG
jgi:peptidoglycan/xylan/chitin deacetylase (PgdA/CDA1 family)